MKKLTYCIMTVFFLLSFIPTQLKAETEKSAATAVTSKTVESTDVNATTIANAAADAKAETELARLEEIKAMDKSNLSASERKALRKEVIAMKKESKEMNGGVYLSVGAIIIVILLLILIL